LASTSTTIDSAPGTYSMTVFLFLILALSGLFIGILSGMFGIGGGTLMIPLLNLAFRLPILTATATSLFVIAPTSLSGAWRHVRQGTAEVRAAVTIGLAGAVASVASSLMSERLPDPVILTVVVAVILYSATSIIREATKKPLDAQGRTSKNRFRTARSSLLARICLGLVAGLVAGVAGVGGGFIIVPFSIAYFGYSFKMASGTSLLAIAFIALPGIFTHALLGHIWYLGGVALMLGTIPGANLGARLITKVPERAARFVFGGLLVISGCLLIVDRIF
jgi:uncharacterized membrane protein YfcA